MFTKEKRRPKERKTQKKRLEGSEHPRAFSKLVDARVSESMFEFQSCLLRNEHMPDACMKRPR